MTRLEEYQLQHVRQYTQFILFDTDGMFLESCDSLFSTNHLRNTPMYAWFPFLSNIIDVINTLEVGREMSFPRVEAPADFLSGVYDLKFIRTHIESENKLLLIISDFTQIYDKYRYFQQQFNETLIEKQYLEIQLSTVQQKAAQM